MSALDNIAKTIGDAVGVVGGGPSQMKAGLALADLRARLNRKMAQLGTVVGRSTGSDFIQSFSQAATASASEARAATAGQYLGVNVDPRKALVYGGLGAGALLLLYVATRKK